MSAPSIKLKIRTVKNVTCDVEIATDKTILDVKKLIESTYNHPVASQRLIFSGKVLENDKTVASYNIESNKMVVLYLKDPAAAPAPTPAATTTTPATPANPTTASTPARAPEPAARPATTPATPASPTAPAAPTGPTNNTTLSAQEFSDAVQNIVDMGFDRNDAQRALNAAYGDSARAVEYIVSGNIPNVNNGPAAGGARAPPPVAAAAGAPAGNPNSPFAQLRQLPQFQGIIALIQQNPALLEPLLQQLAQRDPNIVELIRENREEFLQILQQPVDPNVLGMLQAAAEEEGEEFGEEDEDDIAAQLSAAGALGGNPGAATGAQGGMPRAPPGSTVIQITPQEKEAIDRLVALGFDRNRAIEAFLVCNKDEEMAANYLLEQGFD